MDLRIGAQVRLITHLNFGRWETGKVYEVCGGMDTMPVIENGDERTQLFPHEYEEVVDETGTGDG